MAALVSSATFIAAFGAGIVLWGTKGRVQDVAFGDVANGMFFVVLFGWPIAFFCALLIGFVGLDVLRQRRRQLSLGIATASAAASGAILLSALGLTSSDPGEIWWLASVGLIAGALSGLGFWAVIRKSVRMGSA